MGEEHGKGATGRHVQTLTATMYIMRWISLTGEVNHKMSSRAYCSEHVKIYWILACLTYAGNPSERRNVTKLGYVIIDSLVPGPLLCKLAPRQP